MFVCSDIVSVSLGMGFNKVIIYLKKALKHYNLFSFSWESTEGNGDLITYNPCLPQDTTIMFPAP